MSPLLTRQNILGLLFLALIITVIYIPVFHSEFVEWDDSAHIIGNELIVSLNWDHIKQIFMNHVLRIYMPLTMLSYAIEYHFVQLQPFLYKFDNLLLHLFVVSCIFFLGQRLGLSRRGAFLSALLFGV